MKTLIFSIIPVLFILLAGCRENSIDPQFKDQMTKETFQNHIIITGGLIPLEGILVNPSVPFIEYYDLSGNIEYEHKLLNNPAIIAEVVLNLTVKSNLSNFPGNSVGVVATVTEDTLHINEFGYMLQKSFPVTGNERSMNLICSFLVTAENIVLSDRWLEINQQE